MKTQVYVIALGLILAEVAVAAPPPLGWWNKESLVDVYQVEIVEVPPIPSVLAFDFDAERKKAAAAGGRQLTFNADEGEGNKEETKEETKEEPKEEMKEEDKMTEEDKTKENEPKMEEEKAEEPKNMEEKLAGEENKEEEKMEEKPAEQ